jgi:hypothetical protein
MAAREEKHLKGREKEKSEILVSPSLGPNREIGSGYPSNVYDCNRLPLPILRQK